jgi:hypothetical protein
MINFSTLSTSSDGWTTADLVFLWKEGDPVQVVKNLHLPRFTLEKFLTDYCNSKTNTGKADSSKAKAELILSQLDPRQAQAKTPEPRPSHS